MLYEDPNEDTRVPPRVLMPYRDAMSDNEVDQRTALLRLVVEHGDWDAEHVGNEKYVWVWDEYYRVNIPIADLLYLNRFDLEDKHTYLIDDERNLGIDIKGRIHKVKNIVRDKKYLENWVYNILPVNNFLKAVLVLGNSVYDIIDYFMNDTLNPTIEAAYIEYHNPDIAETLEDFFNSDVIRTWMSFRAAKTGLDNTREPVPGRDEVVGGPLSYRSINAFLEMIFEDRTPISHSRSYPGENLRMKQLEIINGSKKTLLQIAHYDMEPYALEELEWREVEDY